MRFLVYLKGQSLSDVPRHKTSRLLASLVVAASFGRSVGQNAVQLTTGDSWAEVKQKFRTPAGTAHLDSFDGGMLLPPLDLYMPWVDLPLWMIEMYSRAAA